MSVGPRHSMASLGVRCSIIGIRSFVRLLVRRRVRVLDRLIPLFGRLSALKSKGDNSSDEKQDNQSEQADDDIAQSCEITEIWVIVVIVNKGTRSILDTSLARLGRFGRCGGAR